VISKKPFKDNRGFFYRDFCKNEFSKIHFEIKQSKDSSEKSVGGRGFCMPCLRMDNAYEHLANLNLSITKELSNPDGPCYFFTDIEGIDWHIKSYIKQDDYINI